MKDYNNSDQTFCAEVIISTQARRGKGERLDPLRVITQVFTKKGKLIAEHDPSPNTFTAQEMIRFTEWHKSKGLTSPPTITDVVSWDVSGRPSN